jgi:hypothetical protein
MLLTFNGRKLLKIIYNSLFAVGFLGLLWTMAIYNTYIDKLPRSLNAATGNIYSLNAHGIGVFQTLQERRHLDYVEHGSWGIIICGVALGLIDEWTENEKIRKRNSRRC